jgi:hypothetical protein
LVVVTVGDPCLNLGAIKRTSNKLLMEGMLVVVTLLAHGVEPRNEAGAYRCDRDLGFWNADRSRQIGGHFGP